MSYKKDVYRIKIDKIKVNITRIKIRKTAGL